MLHLREHSKSIRQTLAARKSEYTRYSSGAGTIREHTTEQQYPNFCCKQTRKTRLNSQKRVYNNTIAFPRVLRGVCLAQFRIALDASPASTNSNRARAERKPEGSRNNDYDPLQRQSPGKVLKKDEFSQRAPPTHNRYTITDTDCHLLSGFVPVPPPFRFLFKPRKPLSGFPVILC